MKIKPTATALIAGFQFCVLNLFAQAPQLTLSTTYNKDRSVDINYKQEHPGTFTVIIKFKELTNCLSGSRQVEETRGNIGKLLTLNPNNQNENIVFSYSYNYLRGKLKPKFNSEFLYLLPYRKGKNIRVNEADFVAAKYFGNTAPEDWKSYYFSTPEEDTVTAIRKGVVVEVRDVYETENPGNAVYTTKKNEVLIEHGDGTLCRYRGLKKGIFVNEGETVYPGSPIGMNMHFQANSKDYGVSVQVYYLKSDDVESNEGTRLNNAKTLYGFVTPHFYTASAPNVILNNRETYISGVSPEVLQKELSKKELKSLNLK